MKILYLISHDNLASVKDVNENKFLWDSYNTHTGTMSIPSILEQRAEELRTEYLEWSSSFAIDKISGNFTTLLAFLSTEILNGGSYWWQTLIADKSPYKSKSIYDVLKLRVLEKIYLEDNFESLIYKGNDKKIAKVLNLWLNKLGHQFRWEKSAKNNSYKLNFKLLYRRLPKLLQSCCYLLNFCLTKLINSKRIRPNPKAFCTIVSYFPGIDLSKAQLGEFHSNYWGPFHNLLKRENISINWIWIYENLQQFTYKESIQFQTRLNNSDTNSRQRYLLLEDNINAKSLVKALREYFKLYFKSFFLKSIQKKFSFSDSNLNFFKILENDWWESFRGENAIINCLHSSSFQELSNRLPSDTNLIIYLWENQPWEQSLLSLKQVFKKANFVGVLHTPACCAFFNLKGFPGHTNELSLSSYARPCPDFIAVPSENTRKAMVLAGWSEDRLVNVEALRYINSLSAFSYDIRDNLPINNRILLVVTGSLLQETKFQLNLLIGADKIGGLSSYSKIIIKPHPSVSVKKILEEVKFSIPYLITENPLSTLWNSSDVVFTSNSTSVSLEAYYIGLPLIITGTLENLNINSLFRIKNINFVTNINELFNNLNNPEKVCNKKNAFFDLDPNLPKWTTFLRSNNMA